MKGPYERLKYDFRRGWECPVCKRKEKTDFTVTFRHCPCGTKKDAGRPVVMTLVEDGVRRVWQTPKRVEEVVAVPHVAEEAVVETIPESAASIPEPASPPPPVPPEPVEPPADSVE